MSLLYLSQRDPKWANDKLGNSGLSIYNYGCATVDVSILTGVFGIWQTPAELAAVAANYDSQGYLQWEELNKMLKSIQFTREIQGRNDAAIVQALKGPNTACILQVDYGKHWVVCLHKMLTKNDYACLDPWTGKECDVLANYHNITKSAHFVKK